MIARTASRVGRGIRLGAVVGVLAVLAGCTPTPTADPTQTSSSPFSFTLSDLPHLDGSTASIPLISLVMQQLAGVPKTQADNVEASSTPVAYGSLACGPVNPKGAVVLAHEAAKVTKDAIANCAQLEYHAIGRDALVFVANEKNAVDSLTTEELKGIYSGKVTNWKAVGGADQKILAFQQNQSSGSQALLDKFVIGSSELAPAPKTTVMGDKGVLQDGLASYNNAANAIGYTVFHYAKQLYSSPDAKLLSADGVQPSVKTIEDGSYPYVNDFYAVIRADEPDGSPARRVVDWLESAEGQKAITDAGYVAGATGR